jgi:hypothetical protein
MGYILAHTHAIKQLINALGRTRFFNFVHHLMFYKKTHNASEISSFLNFFPEHQTMEKVQKT